MKINQKYKMENYEYLNLANIQLILPLVALHEEMDIGLGQGKD